MMKRLLSLLLAGILIFSLVPAQVLATDSAEDAAPSEEATAPTVMLMTDPVNSSDGDDSEGDDDADPSEQAEAETPDAPRKVTFDPTNGSESTIVDVENGSTVDWPKDPEKDGFIFGGWYNGDTPWDFAKAVTEDIKLTAQWLEAVTVTFDTDGGSEVDPEPVVKGGTVPEPLAPEKTNFKFAGWYDKNGYKWNFTANKVETNITLTAKWKLVVTFDTDGGKITPAPQYVEKGDKVSKPTEKIEKDGFEFGGWYDEYGNEWDFDKNTVEGTTILYAKWKVKFSFNSNYGTEIDPQVIDIGGTATRPADNPERAGCEFVDWYNPSLTKPWDFKSPVYTETEVVAMWTTTVTYINSDNSTFATQTATMRKPTSDPGAPERTDCQFDGWYDAKGNKWDFKNNNVTTPNLKLHAKWKVTVTLINDDITYAEYTDVAEGGKIDKPADPTKSGYALEGWYTDKTYSTKWNFNLNTFTENTTLYAKWEEAVDVKFNTGNGTITVPVGIGKTVTKPEDPKKNDHEFAGWYKDENCTDPWDFKTDTVEAGTEPILYAKWLELFDVTFHSNGGDKVSSIEVANGSTFTEPAAPTKDNYIFGGWYKEPTLTNPWDFKTDTVEDDTPLYAKWNHIVVFDTDDGSDVPVQGVANGGTVTKPANDPTKTNFVFGGWYADEDLIDEWDFEKDTINGTTTIYAKWMVEVTFDSKDGSAVDPDTVILDIGDPVEEPDDPVKSNNVFKGWYNGSSKWDFEEDTVSKNTTLTAKWEANPLVIKISATNVYPGDAPTFTVTLNGKTDSTLDIEWSVSGNTDEDTDISDAGVLTIGAEEEAETLTVTAKTGTYRSDFYVTLYPTYDFKSGSGGKWAQKSTKSLTFECNGPMDKISTNGIKIGSSAVSTTNYTIEESSYGFKLTLKSAAMSSLSVAEHKLTITFDDGGKAETTFEVIKESDIPETGDFVSLPLWCMLLAVTAAAALMLKKRQA